MQKKLKHRGLKLRSTILKKKELTVLLTRKNVSLGSEALIQLSFGKLSS
jgi:hypothetical protein